MEGIGLSLGEPGTSGGSCTTKVVSDRSRQTSYPVSVVDPSGS